MRNISFDIIGLLLLLFLLISTVIRKMTEGVSNKIFIAAVATAFAACASDILSVMADSLWDYNYAAVLITHTAYLVFHNAQTLLQGLFLIHFLDISYVIFKKRLPLVLYVLPYGVTAALLLTNPATKLIFKASPAYAHGAAFSYLYVSAAFYILMDFVILIKFRHGIKKSQMLGLMSMAALTITAVIIHIILPDQLVECIAVALSYYIVSSTLQRPEENVDTTTGVLNLSAYTRDASRSYRNGKHWNVVMMNIANYDTVLRMVGFEANIGLLQTISDKIRGLNRSTGGKGAVYYLDRGRFRITFAHNERQTAEAFASMLNNEFKLKILHNGFDINYTACIVLARCPEELESFKSLMAFGQDFDAKIPFTGRVIPASEIYNPDDFEIANNIDMIIDKAIENKSFMVYYQPIYSIEKGKYVSAEALLRLKDDVHGFISPEILIPAAERSGAIHKIGEIVFEKVCQFVSSDEYKKLGLEYIEVNLSVAQCMHGDLADRILLTMNQYGITSDEINLEITETAASFTQRVMTENLNKLSRAGITFSLDDYGTGYSNMKRVISLPLKIVKLDKSFVDEQHNPKMWIFLQNTVKMLKDMNMEIVVEGIETQEMVRVFSDLKCDFIQGYFFSRALAKDDFVNFITEAGKNQPASVRAR